MKALLFTALTLLTAISTNAQVPVRIDDSFTNNAGNSHEQILMTAYNSKLYYLTDTGATAGNQHWTHMLSYDGSNPISMVPEAYSTWIDKSNSGGMAILNGKLYCAITDRHVSPTNRQRIVMFDGINPIDIAPNHALDTFGNIGSLTAAGGNLYFGGSKYTTPPKADLWVYNGSGPAAMINLVPGSTSGAGPSLMYTHSGKLYFAARPNATPGALAVLYELNPANNSFHIVTSPAYPNGIQQPSDFASIGGKLYFTANDSNAYQMYSFDGTTIKKLTFLLSGVAPTVKGYARGPYCKYGEDIYFNGSTTDTPHIYTCNVNTGVVMMSAKIDVAVKNSGTTEMIVYRNKLYFTATNASGTELWRFDGQTASMVADINPGAGSIIPNQGKLWLTLFNNNLYFFATNGVSRELYRLYDATGIQQNSWSGSVTVFPNPAASSATLRIALHNAQSLSITLTDQAGRQIYNSGLSKFPAGMNDTSLPMHALAPGQYFYRVSDNSGLLLASGAIVRP